MMRRDSRMTLAALCLVLLAALTHASWNISAKFAAESRHFVWLFSAGSVLVYGPIVIGVVLVEQPHFTPAPLAGAGGDLGAAPAVLDLAADRLPPLGPVGGVSHRARHRAAAVVHRRRIVVR